MESWTFEVFYDGDCPLCLREINMLRWMDRKRKLRFTDIADKAFSPESVGKTMDDLMARIHGRLPDGNFVEGVEVFRQLYSAVGLKPVVFLTRLPLISSALDLGYVWFAKNRLRLTGRCNDKTCQVDAPTGSASP